MKKLIMILLCMLLACMPAGCSKAPGPNQETGREEQTTGETTTQAPEPTTETAEITTAQTTTEEPAEPESFVFQPKVSSAYLKEIFGETRVETWYHIVDAVLAGEETFACPDQDTYDWVIYQFPNKCFPVLEGMYTADYGSPVEGGVGRLIYTMPEEERTKRIEEFEALCTEIMNQTMSPEYSDLENALSLYRYFCSTYVYDTETYDRMRDEYVDDLSAWRLLTTGTGICSEIAPAYSYLLMQAGIDATVMMGGDHEWSYVRINGKNYHVDPTFGLQSDDSLEYFMMNDEKRAEYFDPNEFVICSVYTQEHEHPDYVADDDTFRPLWTAYLDDFDHKTHIMHCHTLDDNGNAIPMKFDYTGY
ncbi:MAG: hypothetical protein IJR36_08365 [Lachnospiraceae bacterium]|nr:hypothetical protein [Lachnospiraceae bacterium]